MPRGELEDGSHYGTNKEKESSQGDAEGTSFLYSMASYVGNKLYENTVGYYWGGEQEASTLSEDPNGARDDEYINMDLLEVAATGIQRFVDENRN